MKCVYPLIKPKIKEAELRTKEKIENMLCFSRSFSEKVKNLTEKCSNSVFNKIKLITPWYY